MKHLYENHDDEMRSKLTEHEFHILPGAWEDMETRLDKFSAEGAATPVTWSAWFIIGAMVLATGLGMLMYQWQNGEMIAEELQEETQSTTTSQTSAADNKNKKDLVATSNTQSNAATTNSQTATSGSTLPEKEPAANYNTVSTTQKPPSRPLALGKAEQETSPLQEPSIAPEQEEENIGQQRQDAQNNAQQQVYTRRTEVTHVFSESTLKWRNQTLPNVRASKAQATSFSGFVDTPLIVLSTPFHSTASNALEFGITGGINTKVYAGNDNFSLTPLVGLVLRKNLNKRYGLQAELQYKLLLQQNLQQLGGANNQPSTMMTEVNTGTDGEINFEAKKANVYGIQRMHLIELPLSFFYNIHPKHQVAMGLKVAYLQGVKTTNDKINSLSNTQLGFNSLDLGVLVGYEYRLNRHFAIGISYNVGFLNLAKNVQQRSEIMQAQFSDNYIRPTVVDEDKNTEKLMPIQVDSEEQIFFQAPQQLHNNDVKILLRYFF